jgi:dTDP-L-rhamnose 4-epimerase
VHGSDRLPPRYLNPEAEFVPGDVSCIGTLERMLAGVDAVFHLAAAVGVGQSMYQVRRYIEANTLGGANLLQLLVQGRHHVRKVIVASSMSVYGEGAYKCSNCGEVNPTLRSKEQSRERKWEFQCPTCERLLLPVPCGEGKPLNPTSIYAITKRDHEETFLCVGRAYGIPTVALRFFNVYGPRQALSNPYTGAVAIFCARMLNGKPPLIFEDGLQSRDFVHLRDVVQANLLALERSEGDYDVLNVGTGVRTTVLDLARLLGRVLGFKKEPLVVNQFREGDIRHCFADISNIQRKLGFCPTVSLEEGLRDLIPYLEDQIVQDQVDQATEELARRKLVW